MVDTSLAEDGGSGPGDTDTRRPDTSEAAKPWDAGNATRTLCAAVQLSSAICDEFIEHHRIEPHHAPAPDFGVDVVAVVTHAYAARRRQRLRDVVLLLLFAAVVVVIIAELPARARLWIVLALVFLAGILLLAAYVLRQQFAQPTTVMAIRAAYDRRPMRAAAHGLAALVAGLTVPVLGVLWLLHLDGGRRTLATVAGLLVAAWCVVAAERYVALLRAHVATTPGRSIDSGVRALPDELVSTLRTVHSAERNLFVHDSEHHQLDPFVGSGISPDPYLATVDVSKGRRDENGNRRTPKRIDVLDLMRELERTGRSATTGDFWCGLRTYVDGRALMRTPWQQGLPFSPLDVTIDDYELRASLRSGQQLCRSYVCMQSTTWDGDLVVTLFLRCELKGDELILNHKVYMLPPIGRGLRRQVLDLPRFRAARLAKAIGFANTHVAPRVLSAPERCASVLTRPALRAARIARERYAIDHGAHHDYGAVVSGRQRWSDESVMHHNTWDDLMSETVDVYRRVSSTLRTYLVQHDVDTSSLSREMNFFQKTYIKSLAYGKGAWAGDYNGKTAPGKAEFDQHDRRVPDPHDRNGQDPHSRGDSGYDDEDDEA